MTSREFAIAFVAAFIGGFASAAYRDVREWLRRRAEVRK